MFRITEDPSSGSIVQCLAKNYKNDSIVSVDMDKLCVMSACCDPCLCASIYIELHTRTYTRTQAHAHTHNGSQYARITWTLSMSTDKLESFL